MSEEFEAAQPQEMALDAGQVEPGKPVDAAEPAGWQLSQAELRVLGSLMEKESTTPEYYPLSLNALMNACNQRSSRDPVMTLSEDEVRWSLDGLAAKGLAGRTRSSEGRVAKYEHHLGEIFNLTRAENALLCLLLLRGAQTPGELRGRSERLYRFDEVSDAVTGLERLIARTPALAAILPRQPGTKECRYTHLLGGAVVAAGPVAAAESVSSLSSAASFAGGASAESGDARIAALEAEVATLHREFAELKKRFEELFA